MIRSRVVLKSGFVLAAMVGGLMPLAASVSADMLHSPSGLRVLGAPARQSEQYLGKSFNFSPELNDSQSLMDGRFNYRVDRDKMDALRTR